MQRITQILNKRSGIYCIVNNKTQKKYVGSSKNLYQRLLVHRAMLRKGNHANSKLQNSWDKHGEESFTYLILEYCPEEDLLRQEQYYINTIKPWYNVVLSVEEVRISEESKSKMSITRKARLASGEIPIYQKKRIYRYSLEGVYIDEFESIKQASQVLNISQSTIHRFLNGEYKKGGGFLWSYTKEESLPPYVKPIKDNSFLNKEVEVTDLETGEVRYYPSLKQFAESIHKYTAAIQHALRGNYAYLKKYMVRYTSAV